jgi:1-acyl-sn-glycerol-3-phosphate acyltransferase
MDVHAVDANGRRDDRCSEEGRRGARGAARRGEVPRISPWVLKIFAGYIRRYTARHFHAVRLSRAGRPPALSDAPLIVVLNHPSWWDPLVCLLLARQFFPERSHFAPIEADALARYRVFARLGFFGIEAGTRRGAATFLDVGRAVLGQPRACLWVTAEGRFTDPRQRPVRLKPGVGHLARSLEAGAVLPLALEYPFWEERCPEALARFGEVVWVETGKARRAPAWTELLEQRLGAAVDGLAAEACRRDREAFEVLLRGRAGIGGVYDLWRRLRARLHGEQFRREHGVADP